MLVAATAVNKNFKKLDILSVGLTSYDEIFQVTSILKINTTLKLIALSEFQSSNPNHVDYFTRKLRDFILELISDDSSSALEQVQLMNPYYEVLLNDDIIRTKQQKHGCCMKIIKAPGNFELDLNKAYQIRENLPRHLVTGQC